MHNMKVINFNRVISETPFDRKNYKQLVEENKFVDHKNFSRATNAGWVKLVPEFEDLVFEFNRKYFMKIAVSTKKIQKKILHSMIERHMEENPIEKHFLEYDGLEGEEKTKLYKEYYYEIETNILLEAEPTIEYIDVVYSLGKDNVNTIAVGTKSKAKQDVIFSLFRSTFGVTEKPFHIGIDYDMTDFLKSLIVDDIKVDGLELGGRIKLYDPNEKTITIDYKGFVIEDLEEISEWIFNGLSVSNVEMQYKNVVFVLDDKYMFTGCRPLQKHAIDSVDGDATLHDFIIGKIDDYCQIEELQLELEKNY